MEDERAGYRQAPRTCPACDTLMEIARVYETSVDVCTACGGAWFDWFDGDLSRLSAKMPKRQTVPPTPQGSRTCPDCGVALHGEQIYGGIILRCEACVGCFVAMAEMEKLAHAHAFEELALSEAAPAGMFAKVLAIFRRLSRRISSHPSGPRES